MPNSIDDYNLIERPVWLKEQSGISDFLENVLKKYDSKKQTNFKLTRKTLADLFDPTDTDNLTWHLLQELCKGNTLIFKCKASEDLSSVNYIDSNITLQFQPETEPLLRQWFNLPSKKSQLETWKTLIKYHANDFNGSNNKLSDNLITVAGRSSSEIINGFIAVKKYLHSQLTLRNLSACCFWQDSKFLDNREDTLFELYPDLLITKRPVLVNIFLPEKIQAVLFIENQDNYTQAVKGLKGISKEMNNLALVFSYGNKLSADRIRSIDGVEFHYHENSCLIMRDEFKQFWTEKYIYEWPIFFWGDLDNEGMRILSNLKQSFKTIEAWQKGYQPMLEMLQNGDGHTPEQAGKSNQKETVPTGCQYTDGVLIPALKKFNRYIDQEVII